MRASIFRSAKRREWHFSTERNLTTGRRFWSKADVARPAAGLSASRLTRSRSAQIDQSNMPPVVANILDATVREKRVIFDSSSLTPMLKEVNSYFLLNSSNCRSASGNQLTCSAVSLISCFSLRKVFTTYVQHWNASSPIRPVGPARRSVGSGRQLNPRDQSARCRFPPTAVCARIERVGTVSAGAEMRPGRLA